LLVKDTGSRTFWKKLCVESFHKNSKSKQRHNSSTLYKKLSNKGGETGEGEKLQVSLRNKRCLGRYDSERHLQNRKGKDGRIAGRGYGGEH